MSTSSEKEKEEQNNLQRSLSLSLSFFLSFFMANGSTDNEQMEMLICTLAFLPS